MEYVFRYFDKHEIPQEIQPLLMEYCDAMVMLDRKKISAKKFVDISTDIIQKLRQNNLCNALIKKYQNKINRQLTLRIAN